MTTTTPNWDALVAERAALRANIDAASARIKDIDAQLITLGYGTRELAGLNVTIAHNRRLDVARFRDAYPIDQHPEMWKVSVDPDTTAIKNAIAPADLDAYYTESTPKVIVR